MAHAYGARRGAGAGGSWAVARAAPAAPVAAPARRGRALGALAVSARYRGDNTDKSAVPQFKRHEADCGSMEVQVAQLQARVTQLTTHMKEHKKDHSARRGLLIVLGQRNKYLKYMYEHDRPMYFNVVNTLGIRSKLDKAAEETA